ncbi:hypothetical protein SSAG_05793 [Streptomyces sp. Mg1]|nr:hypothetical protein SSAG_05793 [Streptomyces sp. Mg1]GHD78562.1 hypothetical protein GCM10010336_59280 [Streptomyces goshikiensis]
MAIACGAMAAPIPTTEAATAAEAIIFLIIVVPFLQDCPVVESTRINAAAPVRVACFHSDADVSDGSVDERAHGRALRWWVPDPGSTRPSPISFRFGQ